MSRLHEKPASSASLTKNQALVLGILNRENTPLSAYAILDELRDEGLRAPLQIYRALDKLVELGLAHRLESANAFLACQHPDCSDHAITVFAICEKCDFVAEISDDAITNHLKEIATRDLYKLRKSVVELHGLCRRCDKSLSHI